MATALAERGVAWETKAGLTADERAGGIFQHHATTTKNHAAHFCFVERRFIPGDGSASMVGRVWERRHVMLTRLLTC